MESQPLTERNEKLKQVLANYFGVNDEAFFSFILPLVTWKELHGNSYLFKQGDPGSQLYFLISGRLQALVKPEGQAEKIVGEITRGETVGEMSLFSDETRSASIKAIRDSHLVGISKAAYQQIITKYPAVNFEITKLIAERLQKINVGEKKQENIRNIALIPLHQGIDIQSFSTRLKAYVAKEGKTLTINENFVKRTLNNENITTAASDSNLYHQFSDWLEKQEFENDYLLFEGEATPSEWTKRCIRQADEIILLADANESRKLTAIEKELLRGNQSISSANQRLIIFHPDQTIQNTGPWLTERTLKSYHHFRTKSESDLARIARFLTRKAAGLVLAGGGARGLSHVGVFKAMDEYNVPVDMVGGTSIGSIAGSLIALDKSYREIYEMTREIFMSNPTPLRDYNLIPIISIISGRKINQILKDAVQDMTIEDMPINFFCVSTNLTRTQAAIHRSGLIRRAIRASISLPGVFPPAIVGNDLHVDGAMFNNMPVDIMEKMGVRYITAVDLDTEGEEDNDFQKMPTGLQYLSSKIWKRKHYNVPSIMTTMIKSSTISSLHKTRKVRSMANLYINPDASKHGFMEWKKFEEFVEIGYRDTIKVLEKWKGFEAQDS